MNKPKSKKPTKKSTKKLPAESAAPNVRDDSFPNIQVISIKDNPDGTADMTYEINDAFVELIKKEVKQDKLTEEDINKWVLAMLTKALNKEDGYTLEKIKKKTKKPQKSLDKQTKKKK